MIVPFCPIVPIVPHRGTVGQVGQWDRWDKNQGLCIRRAKIINISLIRQARSIFAQDAERNHSFYILMKPGIRLIRRLANVTGRTIAIGIIRQSSTSKTGDQSPPPHGKQETIRGI